MQKHSLFIQSQPRLNSNYLSDNFCSFTLKLIQPQKIYTNSKEISGILTFIPKTPILNIPLQVTILGESHCTLFEQTITEQSFLVKDSFSASKSFRVFETQEDIVQKKNEAELCLQSSQFLSQAYNQNFKNPIEQLTKEIFLEGKQQLFQKNKQNQNSNSSELEKRIKVLSANQKYEYEFSFFLPTNVPISVNSKIFPGVHLFVGYKIEASFDMDEKFLLCEEQMKIKYMNPGRKVSVFSEFQIKRVTEQNDDESVANKLMFKYFNPEGKIENKQQSLISCLIKGFCPGLWRQRYCYDLYHCELLTSINDLRILHLTARVFLEPDKDKIDVRKVKRGKQYMTNKKSDPQETEQKPKNKSELTNSKIMPQKDQNPIKINQLKVIFFGQIVGIKKLMIFQKLIQLNRQNYDAVQGELILELLDTYFSQKNELFQIRYWFQIEPIPQLLNEIEQKRSNGQIQSVDTKNEHPNQFNLTFSQLNGKKQTSNSKTKHKRSSKNSQKTERGKQSAEFKIEIVTSEQHFIRI